MDKIEFKVTGTVFGFKKDSETLEQAQARIALEAEMYGNSGSSRIHLEMFRERHFEISRPQRNLCIVNYAGSWTSKSL